MDTNSLGALARWFTNGLLAEVAGYFHAAPFSSTVGFRLRNSPEYSRSLASIGDDGGGK